ncbi:MAG: hypothetical protein QM535_11500 [Limnohabitans sp.]|nr:hypothetical protein [Limnohabitans sp.]
MRKFGSILMILSGFVMLIDVFLNYIDFTIGIRNLHGFNSETNLISFISQWIAIFLILISVKLGAYNITYLSPIYSTLLSIYWVLSDCYGNEKPFLVFSMIGLSLIILVVLLIFGELLNREKKLKEIKIEKNKALEEFLDLTILVNSFNKLNRK